jgi:chromatin structure-remodeling complex subunit RSC1/2
VTSLPSSVTSLESSTTLKFTTTAKAKSTKMPVSFKYPPPPTSPYLTQNLLAEELTQLQAKGFIDSADIPDLGPIPTSSPSEKGEKDETSSSDRSDSESGSEEESDDDEEEAVVEDSEDEEYEEKAVKVETSSRPGLRTRPRRSATKSSAGAEDKKDAGGKAESRKPAAVVRKRKRGRPPKIDTPEEARIRTILRAVRKVKDTDGRQLFLEFDKLPDPELYPDYHKEIKRPIALDHITVLYYSVGLT